MFFKSPASLEPPPLVRPKYRADIDGLRGLAVLLVIGYHAFPNWVRGGFIGVDVFFVISGFLISSIIFEGLRQGSFSFSGFYARRIRRIFPALILVMAACYAFGWFALLPDEYAQLGKHILGGAGFLSNFFFWKEADYFDNSAETKPFIHLWSLGIEEQYYIVWPLLLYVAWKREFKILTLAIVIGLLSFTLNITGVYRDATATFYSPLSRLWELLIGGILAFSRLQKIPLLQTIRLHIDAILGQLIRTPSFVHNSFSLANVQATLGFLLIVVGAFGLNKKILFPGWWALLPTVGTYLIVSADSDAWLNRVVLSNRVLLWFGLISYPLYLWHWPLLSFAQIVESGTITLEIRWAAIGIAVLLAWSTYVLIEKPIRFGKNGRGKVLVLSVLMVVIGTVGYITFRFNGLTNRSTMTEFLYQQQVFSWDEDRSATTECIKQYTFNGDLKGRYCLKTYMDKSPTAALIGDSHANNLFFGLSEYYKKRGENLLLLGERLPFWNLETGPSGTQDTFVYYKDVMNSILDYVTTTDSIKTIILAGAGVDYVNESNYHLKLTTKPNLVKHRDIFEQAMRETLERLVKTGKQIIFVIDGPKLTFDPNLCLGNRPLRLTTKVKSPCATERNWLEREAAVYHATVNTVLQEFPSVKLFNLYNYLCDDTYCWAIDDGKLLYRDANSHLSYDGSLYIGSKFALEQDHNN